MLSLEQIRYELFIQQQQLEAHLYITPGMMEERIKTLQQTIGQIKAVRTWLLKIAESDLNRVIKKLELKEKSDATIKPKSRE